MTDDPDDNVVFFTGATGEPMSPKMVLLGAGRVTFRTLLIIGVDEAGDPYISGTEHDAAKVLWLLECTKRALMDMHD